MLEPGVTWGEKNQLVSREKHGYLSTGPERSSDDSTVLERSQITTVLAYRGVPFRTYWHLAFLIGKASRGVVGCQRLTSRRPSRQRSRPSPRQGHCPGPCTAPKSRVDGVDQDTTSYQYPGPAKHSRTQEVALSPAAAWDFGIGPNDGLRPNTELIGRKA